MAADRDADVLQHLVIDLLEQVHPDFIGVKGSGILAKSNRLQPFLDIAHALSCSQQRVGLLG